MNVSRKKVFWTGFVVAAAGLLVMGLVVAPRVDSSFFQTTLAGYLVASAVTLSAYASILKNGGKRAMGALGIYFLLKLVLLAGGSVLIAYTPAWGEWKGYALGFMSGYFLVMIVSSIFMVGKRSEAKLEGRAHA